MVAHEAARREVGVPPPPDLRLVAADAQTTLGECVVRFLDWGRNVRR